MFSGAERVWFAAAVHRALLLPLPLLMLLPLLLQVDQQLS
jgi:hypothetical protein